MNYNSSRNNAIKKAINKINYIDFKNKIAQKFPLIVEEVQKYPKEFVETFIKLLEADKKYEYSVLYPFIVKGRQVGMTTLGASYMNNNIEIKFDSEEDFWNRWNRYKRLTVFS